MGGSCAPSCRVGNDSLFSQMPLNRREVAAGIDVVGLAFRFAEATGHAATGDLEQLVGVQRVHEHRPGPAPDQEMAIVEELDVLGGTLT